MNEHEPLSSHLFTVRLWLEHLGDGQTEWRGKVQHASSREALYFRDWSTLSAFLARWAQAPQGGASTEEASGDH